MKMQNFFIGIQTASLFMYKQMIFTKTLQKMLKQGLTIKILNQTDDCLTKRNKKRIGLMKDELGGQVMKELVELCVKHIFKRQQ